MSTLDYQEWLKEYTVLTDRVRDISIELDEASYASRLSLSTAVMQFIKQAEWRLDTVGRDVQLRLIATHRGLGVDNEHPVIQALECLFPHGTFTVISGKDDDGVEIDVCDIRCSDNNWWLYDSGPGWSYLSCVSFVKKHSLNVDQRGQRESLEAEVKRVQKEEDNLAKRKAQLINELKALGGLK